MKVCSSASGTGRLLLAVVNSTHTLSSCMILAVTLHLGDA